MPTFPVCLMASAPSTPSEGGPTPPLWLQQVSCAKSSGWRPPRPHGVTWGSPWAPPLGVAHAPETLVSVPWLHTLFITLENKENPLLWEIYHLPFESVPLCLLLNG